MGPGASAVLVNGVTLRTGHSLNAQPVLVTAEVP